MAKSSGRKSGGRRSETLLERVRRLRAVAEALAHRLAQAETQLEAQAEATARWADERIASALSAAGHFDPSDRSITGEPTSGQTRSAHRRPARAETAPRRAKPSGSGSPTPARPVRPKKATPRATTNSPRPPARRGPAGGARGTTSDR